MLAIFHKNVTKFNEYFDVKIAIRTCQNLLSVFIIVST